jgi:hypothetical protein
MASFLGAPGNPPELLVEARDADGALAAFIAAVPRRGSVNGHEVRLALVTLLTSARRNRGMVGMEIERELLRRVAAAGLFGTYHFCIEQRTGDLVRFAAAAEKMRAVELAPVPSLLARAAAAPADPDVRPVSDADLPRWVELLAEAGAALPLHRVFTVDELRAWLAAPPAKRGLSLLRDGRPIGLCVYARRQLVGKEVTELANIDLLVGPEVRADEAARFGKALASDAFAAGAAFLVAPRRAPSVFPFATEAGLRLAMRTLHVLVVPCAPAAIEPGAAHLLEVE